MLVQEHGHIATKRMISEYIQLAEPVPSTIDMKFLPAAAGAYCGKIHDRIPFDRKRPHLANELQHDHGFKLLEYNEQ